MAVESPILENNGYKNEALAQFLGNYPKAGYLLSSSSLVFFQNGTFRFPTSVTKEQETSDPELADKAFRGRVARHTTSVGRTLNIVLTCLSYSGDLNLNPYSKTLATEVMILHDLKKIEEIRLRRPFDSSDLAYVTAEQHMSDLLRRSGYPEEYVQLSGSVGHNGARDFLTAPHLWPLVRQAAYLSDDILQETIIQSDILAKVRRLQTDQNYSEANKTGFPERQHYTIFTNKDGSLKPKFELQEIATIQMAKNLADRLSIDWEDLGNVLIQQAVDTGEYTATIS